MSYCRWSSDDFQCDLYVYESCHGGFVVHVAERRHVFKKPLPPKIKWTKKNHEKWCDRYNIIMEMVEEAELVDIGGPHDGKEFNYPDLLSLRRGLLDLRKDGYLFPDSTLKIIESEIESLKSKKKTSKPKTGKKLAMTKAMYVKSTINKQCKPK